MEMTDLMAIVLVGCMIFLTSMGIVKQSHSMMTGALVLTGFTVLYFTMVKPFGICFK